jgi:hypothetical protein
MLQGVDITEIYSGSSYSGSRWKVYDGTQKRSASIIAGYRLPDSAAVEGGLDFRLPNGLHTGYVQDVVFKDIHIIDKGGNPVEDASQLPPELGLGQYNVSNLKTLPAYGLWARHATGLKVEKSSFNYEKTDDRPAIVLEDVKDVRFKDLKIRKSKNQNQVILQKNSQNVDLKQVIHH